jgi:hypothetical protein
MMDEMSKQLVGQDPSRKFGVTEGKEKSCQKKLPGSHESDDSEVTRLTASLPCS